MAHGVYAHLMSLDVHATVCLIIFLDVTLRQHITDTSVIVIGTGDLFSPFSYQCLSCFLICLNTF